MKGRTVSTAPDDRRGAIAQAFHNIRYGHAERFGPAELVPFVDADPLAARGPISPQLPSRLAIALGPQAPLLQSEDCQVLSVYTPECAGRRPVLVWFHGGAHVSGGGELPWYDGTLLAAEQDIVVVTITSRLGLLGNYYDEGHQGPSPSTTDHLTAIEWVRRHIAEFGGDPGRVTLAGQSAGAFSVEVLLRWGVGPHVVGAILQSGNLRDPDLSRTPAAAREHSLRFERMLAGLALRDLSVEQLLEHQREFAELTKSLTWAPARPDDERPLDIPIVGGWNADDDLPFTMLSRGLETLTWRDRDTLDDQVQADTESLYVLPTTDALREAHDNGAQTWAYRFAWRTPHSPWGSPHCMEIPLLLGDWPAWKAAPMLQGVAPEEIDVTGRGMRHAWAEFARNSCPGAGWSPWDTQTGSINDLPHLVRLEDQR